MLRNIKWHNKSDNHNEYIGGPAQVWSRPITTQSCLFSIARGYLILCTPYLQHWAISSAQWGSDYIKWNKIQSHNHHELGLTWANLWPHIPLQCGQTLLGNRIEEIPLSQKDSQHNFERVCLVRWFPQESENMPSHFPSGSCCTQDSTKGPLCPPPPYSQRLRLRSSLIRYMLTNQQNSYQISFIIDRLLGQVMKGVQILFDHHDKLRFDHFNVQLLKACSFGHHSRWIIKHKIAHNNNDE